MYRRSVESMYATSTITLSSPSCVVKPTSYPHVYLERPADVVMHESVEHDNLYRFYERERFWMVKNLSIYFRLDALRGNIILT